MLYSRLNQHNSNLIKHQIEAKGIVDEAHHSLAADIFTQLGVMERKGFGMGKILNPIRNV